MLSPYCAGAYSDTLCPCWAKSNAEATPPFPAPSTATRMARNLTGAGDRPPAGGRGTREEAERGGGGDVHRPRPHHVEQRAVDRLAPQEHVVAAGRDRRDGRDRREAQRDQVDAEPRAGARPALLGEHEQAGGEDRAAVGRVVGEPEDVGEALPQVGCHHRLQRRAERPEVQELDREPPWPPQRGDRHEGDRVAELKREVDLGAPLAAQRVCHLLADEAGEDDEGERASGDQPDTSAIACSRVSTRSSILLSPLLSKISIGRSRARRPARACPPRAAPCARARSSRARRSRGSRPP